MADPDDNIFTDLQVLFAWIPAKRVVILDDGDEDDEDRLFEPVPDFDHSRFKALVVLVVNETEQIIRVAVGRRGYSAGTGLSQIILSHPETTVPVSIQSIPNEMEPRFQRYVPAAAGRMGLLPPGASKSLLRYLWNVMPEIQRVIHSAKMVRQNPIEAFPEFEQVRLQQESDASLVAMRIAGIRIATHFTPDPIPSQGKWFLDMVAEPRLREDPMIIHDSRIFPEATEIQSHMSGAVRFRQNETVLTVILVNRQPLEAVTGTDLIYYNETFSSFVMVQYKAMEEERDDHCFRIPDPGLDKEIEQMKKFRENLNESSGKPSAHGYRLNKGAFFLKFCPRSVPQLKHPELVPGMYFSLNHWNLLTESDHFKGPKGGKALRFQRKPPFSNAGRYLTNTEFIGLVGKAWVGTTVKESKVVEKIIQHTLQTGRSVTLAVENSTDSNESEF